MLRKVALAVLLVGCGGGDDPLAVTELSGTYDVALTSYTGTDCPTMVYTTSTGRVTGCRDTTGVGRVAGDSLVVRLDLDWYNFQWTFRRWEGSPDEATADFSGPCTSTSPRLECEYGTATFTRR